jgi:hypothetical protein
MYANALELIETGLSLSFLPRHTRIETDDLVHPNDAFWNSSKPWGDWRVGAESDPACCGNTGRTVSSFDVLDHMLTILTDKKLFPRMNKIAYVGHSAGTLTICFGGADIIISGRVVGVCEGFSPNHSI